MIIHKLSKLYHYIRCIPKSIFFNFYYLPLKKAVRLPILVNHRTKFLGLGGTVTIPTSAKTGKIRLGFGKVQVADSKYSRFIWNVSKGGHIELGNKVKLGTGSKLHIQGELCIKSNCNFTGETTIICNKKITFGTDCLISWQTLIMDSDLHNIQDEKGVTKNPNKSIHINDSVWVGARSTILKGVTIESNSVVANSSVITKSFPKNSIIGGNPAKEIGSFDNLKFNH